MTKKKVEELEMVVEGIGTLPDNRDEEAKALQDFVLQWGQFPFKERKSNYQDYWLEGYGYIPGSRNVKHRYVEMQLPDYGKFEGSVLDLGCQIGAMVQEAYMRGGHPCIGLDFQPEFIDCARKIAKFNDFDIGYYVADLTKVEATHKFINSLYGEDFVWDNVFALSIFKHIEKYFAPLLKGINFKNLYIEGHNAGDRGFEGDMNSRIEKFLDSTGWSWTRLGMTTCRSPRCLWLARR